MKTSSETFQGELVDSIATTSDTDAHDQLMVRTGQFLNLLDHVARCHPKVITGDYLGDVLDDLDYLGAKYGLPDPVHPSVQ